MTLGPSYKLPKITWLLSWLHSTPNKSKEKAQIYLYKDLNLEARLWNGNVLGTHPTVRDLKSASQKREIDFVCFLRHLSFLGKWSGVATYLKKKKKKKLNT